MASSGLLAYICVAKYVDHLPLYRLERKFERIFVSLPRLTMARWMIKVSEVLTPLYNLMQDELLGGGILQMDETSVQVLKEPGREASAKSYMWVRARDRTTGPPIVLYDYFPSRATRVVNELLSGYTGILQTDGYFMLGVWRMRAENSGKHLKLQKVPKTLSRSVHRLCAPQFRQKLPKAQFSNPWQKCTEKSLFNR